MSKTEEILRKWEKEDAAVSMEYHTDELNIQCSGDTHTPIFSNEKFVLIVGDMIIEGILKEANLIDKNTIKFVLKNDEKIILKKC